MEKNLEKIIRNISLGLKKIALYGIISGSIYNIGCSSDINIQKSKSTSNISADVESTSTNNSETCIEWLKPLAVVEDLKKENHLQISSLQQTTDGGYIIAGQKGLDTDSLYTTAINAWIMKTNSSGEKEWEKKYGHPENGAGYFSNFSSVQQTAEGGYILGGYNHLSPESYFDALLIKTNSSGEKQWEKTYDMFKIYSIQQTADKGYIFTQFHQPNEYKGSSNGQPVYINLSSAWLIKTDSSGNEEWHTGSFGTKDENETNKWGNSPFFVQQTADKGYIIAGSTYNHFDVGGQGVIDAWISKIDASGKKEWEKIIGGDKDDVINSFRKTKEGDYILAGYTNSYGLKDSNFWLVKIDNQGNEKWYKTFGKTKASEATSVQQTNDGGYILAGVIWEPSMCKTWVIKTNSLGEMQWETPPCFNKPKSDWYIAKSILQTKNEDYIIVGDNGYGEGNFAALDYAALVKIKRSGCSTKLK